MITDPTNDKGDCDFAHLRKFVFTDKYIIRSEECGVRILVRTAAWWPLVRCEARERKRRTEGLPLKSDIAFEKTGRRELPVSKMKQM